MLAKLKIYLSKQAGSKIWPTMTGIGLAGGLAGLHAMSGGAPNVPEATSDLGEKATDYVPGLVGGAADAISANVPDRVVPSQESLVNLKEYIPSPSGISESLGENMNPYTLAGAGAAGVGGALGLKHLIGKRLAAQRAQQANARIARGLGVGALGLGGLAGASYLMSGNNNEEDKHQKTASSGEFTELDQQVMEGAGKLKDAGGQAMNWAMANPGTVGTGAALGAGALGLRQAIQNRMTPTPTDQPGMLNKGMQAFGNLSPGMKLGAGLGAAGLGYMGLRGLGLLGNNSPREQDRR
jgi:hypothetical protein